MLNISISLRQPLAESTEFVVNCPLSDCRALTPLFGNGAGAHGIGKISGVLTKIGKLDIVLMYDIYIARLIPIIKLTLVYYEKRERKKQVFLYPMK